MRAYKQPELSLPSREQTAPEPPIPSAKPFLPATCQDLRFCEYEAFHLIHGLPGRFNTRQPDRVYHQEERNKSGSSCPQIDTVNLSSSNIVQLGDNCGSTGASCIIPADCCGYFEGLAHCQFSEDGQFTRSCQPGKICRLAGDQCVYHADECCSGLRCVGLYCEK